MYPYIKVRDLTAAKNLQPYAANLNEPPAPLMLAVQTGLGLPRQGVGRTTHSNSLYAGLPEFLETAIQLLDLNSGNAVLQLKNRWLRELDYESDIKWDSSRVRTECELLLTHLNLAISNTPGLRGLLQAAWHAAYHDAHTHEGDWVR